MKRTHKFQQISNVEAVIARCPNLAVAARELGVDRSTLTRWMQKGKLKRPAAPLPTPPPAPGQSPADWEKAVRGAYVLSETQSEMVDLAQRALTMARDEAAAPHIRLAAMARFAALSKQLNLQAVEVPASKPERPVAVVRRSVDPRAVLMAVK